MYKLSTFLFILFISCFLLAACNNADEGEVSNSDLTNESTNDHESKAEEDTNDKTEKIEKQDPDSTELNDQLELKIGDTGTFDTTLGTYDITLDAASLKDELDGKYPQFDAFIILDLTLKNTSNHSLDIDDLIISMEVSNLVDGSGFSDTSGGFESIDMLTGTIEPGEEVSGQFVTEVYDIDTSDEYYFKKNAGNTAGGSSNQVIWTIATEEAK